MKGAWWCGIMKSHLQPFWKIMKIPLVILISLALTGCAKQSFYFKDNINGTPAKEETHHFFISGLGQKKNIDAAEVCGGIDKVSRTETQLTFMNGILNVLTFGIYTPREATVYCSNNKLADVPTR